MYPSPGFNSHRYFASIFFIYSPPFHTHTSPNFGRFFFFSVSLFNSSALNRERRARGWGLLAGTPRLWAIHWAASLFLKWTLRSVCPGLFSRVIVSSETQRPVFGLGRQHLSTNVMCTGKGEDRSFNKPHTGSAPFLMPAVSKTV